MEENSVIEAINDLKEMVTPLTEDIEFIKNKYIKPVHNLQKCSISNANQHSNFI